MIINHNISALNTHRQLGANNNAVQSSLEKLSSGLRINRAGDDAAGLAISEKMRGQIRGLDMATKNAQDGISLIQTAEGALTETHSILHKMRELSVQAGNLGTQEEDDLTAIQDEMQSLIDEIDGIAERTQFNGKDLLTGDFADEDLIFQIGANAEQNLTVNIEAMNSEALGLNEINVSEFTASTDFDKVVETIDQAIKDVSSTRSGLGAIQNRLEHTINNLGASSENLTAAESRIRDVDHTQVA